MSPEKSSTLLSDNLPLTTRLRRLMPFVLSTVGILLMIGGIVINYIQNNQTNSVSEKTPVERVSVAGIISARMVSVEASGAVEKPGVYQIPYDSRVKDVLITAGGLVAKADRNYISKNINLAQHVSDGQKVYFPFEGESIVSNSQPLSGVNNAGNLININSATLQELDTLPGIGPVTAQKIVTQRPYQSLSELVSRKVILGSVYDKIKDKITAN